LKRHSRGIYQKGHSGVQTARPSLFNTHYIVKHQRIQRRRFPPGPGFRTPTNFQVERLVDISSYQRAGGGNSPSICAVINALKQVHIAQLVRAVVKAPLSRSKGPEFGSHQLRCRVQLWASRSRIHASVANRIGLLWC